MSDLNVSSSLGATPVQTAYLALAMIKTAQYLQMMVKSFPEMDEHREFLAQNGSWTSRITSIERYARVDTYA